MRFLAPAFLIGAVAIAIPVVLHLLRREVAPDVPFTAVRLLQKSPVERTHRRRLKDVLLLVARVVALLLLAFAFARPYVQGAAPAPLRVVAIDRSFSMGGAERFERARALARAAIDESAGERVVLVAFDDRAEVLSEPGAETGARAALDRLAPGYGATRFPALFDTVAELAGGARGRLVLISDLQAAGWGRVPNSALPAGWELELKDAGPLPTNLALTAVTIGSDRLVASITNTGAAARTTRLGLELDGRPAAEVDVTIPPGATASKAVEWRPPADGALTVVIDDPGGLPADDRRYVALGAGDTLKALILTSGGRSGLYVTRALDSAAGEESAVAATAVDGGRATPLPTEVDAYPVVVLLSTRGLDREARAALGGHVRSGAGLFIAAAPDLDASVLASLTDWQPPISVAEAEAQSLTFAATDPRHPIFRPFGSLAANLGQARFTRRWRVQADGWTTLAAFSDGTPALLERALGAGRVVLFASDLDRRWNDLPLHPAFVPFVLEAVRHTAGSRREPYDYTVREAPPGTGPGPGVYKTPDNRLVTVNVDPAEGSPDRLTPEHFASRVERPPADAGRSRNEQARQTEARQNYWRLGLLVMIAALVAESFVGRS